MHFIVFVITELIKNSKKFILSVDSYQKVLVDNKVRTSVAAGCRLSFKQDEFSSSGLSAPVCFMHPAARRGPGMRSGLKRFSFGAPSHSQSQSIAHTTQRLAGRWTQMKLRKYIHNFCNESKTFGTCKRQSQTQTNLLNYEGYDSCWRTWKK